MHHESSPLDKWSWIVGQITSGSVTLVDHQQVRESISALIIIYGIL